jgi:hypothetical protein
MFLLELIMDIAKLVLLNLSQIFAPPEYFVIFDLKQYFVHSL